MEVIVPEHPADNNAADLRGMLCGLVPMCFRSETQEYQKEQEKQGKKQATKQGKYRRPGSVCFDAQIYALSIGPSSFLIIPSHKT